MYHLERALANCERLFHIRLPTQASQMSLMRQVFLQIVSISVHLPWAPPLPISMLLHQCITSVLTPHTVTFSRDISQATQAQMANSKVYPGTAVSQQVVSGLPATHVHQITSDAQTPSPASVVSTKGSSVSGTRQSPIRSFRLLQPTMGAS
jgi:hypothetical protein